MGQPAEISQRDLRMRSREIMDAVERGDSFVVTRDGRGIGQLIPLRQRRTFIPRDEVQALLGSLPAIDAQRFRADLDAVVDPYADDPYGR
ncbi:type II toxin-antitoxin system Phd/YefM family antitoxin [Mycolicibacterium brumae]|uniref:Type II toxin-antitoxin system prevent-host-death family antitoxin n=1 Tax=Mycolicibacterium brumae TaxID=85968 RepID=A0A2G5PAC8_9MYCO|nr:type II toxin-antitoxin system prevent-host-death family antitoxin [Mycolicibacterium brumae]MCV7193995.1 type II toxin-antitoxin system prevent-host-death family antitoxin [Mycolicibacterium brumae]PIB74943.1 type II toxin-antitoxin system prevent-host-death family antitoxin [Mycolicibacterium brumae]RWA22427.1 hypothetical protein MBRU_12660 [Mycolicibacterium brumae DSM 44177]UWW08045.1 type II toxin-antitoxin system prevent-host-death family antitoxin [Mycolicibacterium brumae]